MTFRLSQRSKNRLTDVHPDLVKVVRRAIELTSVDFGVLEGARTLAKQKDLFAIRASLTMDSRHLPSWVAELGKEYAHAVDLGAYYQNELRWDWPLYTEVARAMFAAATELDVDIQWGGNWRSFKDGPHFQLSRRMYPKEQNEDL